MNMEILDVANGTEPITYQVQYWVADASYTTLINRSLTWNNDAFFPGGLTSTITVKEVCQ